MLCEDARRKIIAEFGLVEWRPRIARCMVLLSQKQRATKVLDGMQKVLALPSEHCVRVIVPDLDLSQVQVKISQWQPEYILQLTMEYPKFSGENVYQTYSPDYLRDYPKCKAEAYKVLLALKEKINHDAA